MIEELMGQNGFNFLVATAAVVAGLLLLVLVLWIMKNRSSSTFIRGGKNRQPRLAVLDAAAVDTRRRLVLIRRDDVEHLIMIGGPTDIVIESRIGEPAQQLAAQQAAAVVTPEARQAEIRPSEIRQPETRQQELKPAEIRPLAETRTEPRPSETRVIPETRPQNIPQVAVRTETRPEPQATPVSAMGQVLYSERDEEPLRQVKTPLETRTSETRPVETKAIETRAVETRSAVNPAIVTPVLPRDIIAQQRQPAAENIPAVQTPQPVFTARSIETGASAHRAVSGAEPAPAGITPSLNAEDILDAARARVLPQQRETPVVTAAQTEAQIRPQPVVEADGASDFERILDAQISGDLQRLTPGPQTTQAKPGERREPPLTTPVTGARTEPTIEQEMARMLGELSVSRNN